VEFDPLGLPLVIITLLLCAITSYQAFRNYRTLGTEFFKYSTLTGISLVLMTAGYLFPTLFLNPENRNLVYTGQIVLASFGMLALACLTNAFESVRHNPRDSLINAVFAISGAQAASRFLPGQYVLTWTEKGWSLEYGLGVMITSLILLVFTVAATLPLVYRVWKRIGESRKYNSLIRFILIIFACAAIGSGLYHIVSGYYPELSQLFTLSNNLLFLIFISLAVSIAIILYVNYPTIFFASNHDILELQILDCNQENLLYCFKFQLSNETNKGPRELAGAHESIKQILQQALESEGELKRIHVQENEVLAIEGKTTYAILVTKQGSDLQYSLLRLIQREYEQRFLGEFAENIVNEDFPLFDSVVRKYFQFALSRYD
jgi:hypothetical protein